jgi:hypothetical protein
MTDREGCRRGHCGTGLRRASPPISTARPPARRPTDEGGARTAAGGHDQAGRPGP